jgi:broad specificity phosphatase PhoE
MLVHTTVSKMQKSALCISALTTCALFKGPLHPIDGYEQGVAIARRIASMEAPPDVVYASHLHRAVSTAQMIVHALGKTKNSIRIEEGLTEWLTPSVSAFAF